ncbi:hypothetical protein BH11BAC3_BH11BAC3_03110 [soil metagenome]
MENEELISAINSSMSLEFSAQINLNELHQLLAEHINYLIQKDFQKLVFVLYRVDVNESKLKLLLQENRKEDAGNIIATLIIERQLQKIKSRKEYRQKNDDIKEDEKW